ncbi:hypothetical protein MPSEU_001000600 [Mayamaea pseudoterrestris]|nr:hypothetical protein MPSEU_001000600 [Mayamaea pseudoterrestris]
MPPMKRKFILPNHQESRRHIVAHRTPAAEPHPLRVAMVDHYDRDQADLNQDKQRALQALANVSHSSAPNQMPECPRHLIHCEHYYRQQELNYRTGIETGNVYVWGTNDSQQLGQPAHVHLAEIGQKKNTYGPLSVFIEKALDEGIRQIAAGSSHCIVLSDKGIPYTWGMSDLGLLGRPVVDAESEATPSPIVHEFMTDDGRLEKERIAEVAAGSSFNLFRSFNGNIYFCGFFTDEDGQSFKPLSRGDRSSVGEHPTPVHVSLGGNKRAIRLHVGPDANYCAVEVDDGQIYTFGMGTSGQLAHDNAPTDLGRSSYISVVNEEKVVNEDFIAKHLMMPAPAVFALGLKVDVLSVACGQFHLVVAGRPMNGNGESFVYVSGHNGFGQLGCDLAVTEKHELTELPYFNGKNIVRVAAGQSHSLAMDISGSFIYAWGSGAKAELGQGRDFVPSVCFNPQLVKFPRISLSDLNVTRLFRSIHAGGNGSMAITVDGEIFTWGFGDNGATGHETQADEEIYWARQLKVDEMLAGKRKGNKFDILSASMGHTLTMILVDETSRKRKHPAA